MGHRADELLPHRFRGYLEKHYLKGIKVENQSVNVNMTVAQWNVVMNALGQRPFAEVAEIIGVIKTQAEAQLAPKPAEEPAKAE